MLKAEVDYLYIDAIELEKRIDRSGMSCYNFSIGGNLYCNGEKLCYSKSQSLFTAQAFLIVP